MNTLDTIDENQKEKDSLIADLPVITAEDQAQSTLDNSSSQIEVETEDSGPGYPNPQYGRSSVDLSNPEAEKQMWEEYDEWWNLGRTRKWGVIPITDPEFKDERNRLRDLWYLKYHGVTYEDSRDLKVQAMQNSYQFNPQQRLDNTFQFLSTPGLGWADFGTDVIGNLPGLGVIDDYWDQKTRLNNPNAEVLRKSLSIILPAIKFGGLTTGKVQALNLPKYQKALAALGIFSAQEAALIGVSDQGEEHNFFRVMSDVFPGIFGSEGTVPLPDAVVTLDTDSRLIRKKKNMYDTGILSGFGTLLGIALKLKTGSKWLSWMEPLDEASTAYKAKEIEKVADVDKLIKIQDIDTQISLGGKNLSKQVENQLIAERERLVQSLDNIDDLDAALDSLDDAAVKERNIAARTSDELNPNSTDFDPNKTPIVDDSANPRQSPEPGNVAKNMADTTGIKLGVASGDPAPIITEAMRRKGLMVGSTNRDAVMGVAEESRDLGRFNALVEGFRFTNKQMNAAAWDIYTSIIAAENMDEVRDLFLQNKDVKNMLLGKFQVEYINEEQARAAAFAMRDLVDRFLGREIAQSSGRVMDTLGRESSTMAEAIQSLKGFTNENAAMDLILEKMNFLMDEYALNKYISGWSLRNKNWFDQVPPKEIDSVIDQLQKEFRSAENAIHAKNLAFSKELKRLAKDNPLAMRPLVDAFAHTNGDVDSLAKLMKWSAEQITPVGMLKSPDPKQLNLFTRSAWGVIYNNVLSGISAFRAGLGNTSQLILKPITGILGHGIWGFADDFEGLKRSFYYNGAVFETNRRAIHDAYQAMKKAHKDPQHMMKSYRKDFVFKSDKTWDIMEDMRAVWEQEGNWGRIFQYDMAKNLNDMSKVSFLRYGMTGMVFDDVFSNVHLAHYMSRVRAYDDVFSEFGFADWKKIAIAEKKHYKEMFDANNLPTDQTLKALSGEVSLNLDDGLSNWINQGTTAYPISKFLFMFPRTGSNWVKNSLSWTPIQLIPGISKYSKTIYARTDEDIAAALLEHGIDFASEPNARVIFENLRAEYTGRVAFGSLLTKLGWDYSMAGNIRGNGHHNASRRNKERDQLGYQPKTINIGGKWVSYKGIPGVDPILSILGDMSYYARDLDQALLEDWQAKLMWTISATFLNETPLQGLEPLIAAFNGDLSGWTRLVANSTRAMIPQSGALGVLSNAITSTQKDINADIIKYVQNKTPIASSFLPEQIDIWTGEPLNDIDNPFLRILNSLSPIKVSGTEEPWRKWLLTTGWDGLSRLKKSSDGSYQYTEKEREIIYKYMGEMELYKELIPLMNNKNLNEDIGKLRSHRVTGQDLENERIKLKAQHLPLFKEIDRILKEAQVQAEQRLIHERPDIANTIKFQKLTDNAMKKGDVDRANQLQRKELETQQLLQMVK